MECDSLAVATHPHQYHQERSSYPRFSVFVDSKTEIDKFKWIESERAGFDMGEGAVRTWVSDHWRGYLRARWLEHLQGKKFWIELDRGDFGLLSRAFAGEPDLLNRILEKLKAGQENLEVICWAYHNRIPTEPVVRILEALDINSRRLLYKFDTSTSTSPPAPAAC